MLTTEEVMSIPAAREKLLAGGVIIFPTETVYGIGVLQGNVAAEKRLRALKGRDATQPFQRLIAAENVMARAEKFVTLTPRARQIIRHFLPGALTVILPANNRASQETTYGLRSPAHGWLQKLLFTLPAPLVASSANRAGQPPPITAAIAAAVFGDEVDLIIDDGDVDYQRGNASTVISLLEDELKILRHGAISESAIRAVLAAA